MQISGIMILRDGGTILFEISNDALAGKYRLQTPWAGKPEPLFHDERRLDFGSTKEVEVAAKLKAWFADNLTDELKQSLIELDNLKEWRNISPKLNKSVPYHRIRHVLHVLEARLP
jgi:hypothetical protein